ncbi:hypothetical protein ACFQ5D_10935 [Paenibacillus farraposensis]|uniref:Uncharacterized protein n=1 Tax=Paenibacillus farraposensis TaxID=2807095 RepID=A0ABW4DB60_9BACL|nr:hypothetical protein [Paenibacillus farraposensis]MCC3380737.1 hypothetical protein [Paenibacillus farraposensis]
MTTPNIDVIKNKRITVMTTQEYPEGDDLAYDILRLLNKHQVSCLKAERILEQAKEYVKEHAQLNGYSSHNADSILVGLNDKEQKILNVFAELSNKIPSMTDMKMIKEVSSMDAPWERIIELIRKCFSDYKPRHPEDRIRTFGYCKSFILLHLSKN